LIGLACIRFADRPEVPAGRRSRRLVYTSIALARTGFGNKVLRQWQITSDRRESSHRRKTLGPLQRNPRSTKTRRFQTHQRRSWVFALAAEATGNRLHPAIWNQPETCDWQVRGRRKKKVVSLH